MGFKEVFVGFRGFSGHKGEMQVTSCCITLVFLAYFIVLSRTVTWHDFRLIHFFESWWYLIFELLNYFHPLLTRPLLFLLFEKLNRMKIPWDFIWQILFYVIAEKCSSVGWVGRQVQVCSPLLISISPYGWTCFNPDGVKYNKSS